LSETGKKKRVGKKSDTEEPGASGKPEKKKSKAKRDVKKTAPKKTAKKQVGEGKGRAGSAPRTKKQPPETAGAELDPFEVAKQTMKGSVPEIVNSLVKMAKAGSCTHAKTLLEMTGAKHMFDDEAEGHGQESGEPWAKLVLERLDEAEAGTRQSSGAGQEEVPETMATGAER
jgi:hypothetical protein